jgi:hypothetical protein
VTRAENTSDLNIHSTKRKMSDSNVDSRSNSLAIHTHEEQENNKNSKSHSLYEAATSSPAYLPLRHNSYGVAFSPQRTRVRRGNNSDSGRGLTSSLECDSVTCMLYYKQRIVLHGSCFR